MSGFINDIYKTNSLLLIGKQSQGGTGIYDDFSNGVYNSFWDSDFTSNWSLNQYPPASGNYSSVKGSTGYSDLTDPTVSIGGDFNLEVGFILGADQIGNTSHKLKLRDSSHNDLCQIWSSYEALYIEYPYGTMHASVYFTPISPYDVHKMRLVRTGNSVQCQYFDDFSATPSNAWENLGTAFTLTDNDIYLQAEGADKNGIDYFNFTADYGLPSIGSEGSDFLAHRLERDVNVETDLIQMWDGLDQI